MDFVSLLSKKRPFLMGISIIMVMFFHNLWVRDVEWLKPINDYGFFGVDVFLFVSGFGIFYSLKKNSLKTYFRNRIVRIIPLCLICGFVKFIISHFVLHDDSSWGWQSLIGFDQWYIKGIIVLYLLSPCFYKLLEKYGYYLLILSYIVAIISLQVITNLTLCLFLPRIPVFLLGMMIASNKIKFSNKLLIVSFLFFVIAVFHRLSIICGWMTLGSEMHTVLFLSIGIFFFLWLLLCLYHLFKWLNLMPFMNFSGRHSLELYLLHTYVYWNIIPAYYSQLPPALTFATAIMVSYVFAYFVFLLNLLLPFHKR